MNLRAAGTSLSAHNLHLFVLMGTPILDGAQTDHYDCS